MDAVIAIEKAMDLLQCVAIDKEIKLKNAAWRLNLSSADTAVIAEVLSQKGLLIQDMHQQTLRAGMKIVLGDIRPKEQTTPELPKGIDWETLKIFIDALSKLPPRWEGTSQELGKIVGFSNSTTRMYLEYLVTQGVFRILKQYQKVGRPKNKYRLVFKSA